MEQSHGILDVVKLIQAAGKSGVKSLKCKDLEVEFFEKTPRVKVKGIETGAVQEPIPVQEELALDESTVEKIEAIRKERELDDLMINDPLAYEEIVEKSLTN